VICRTVPYELSPEQARRLHGHRVEAFARVGCPADVGDGFTSVATFERIDGVERHVYLKGERRDIGAGTRLTVPRRCEKTVGGGFMRPPRMYRDRGRFLAAGADCSISCPAAEGFWER
jgi:hypothetical protein